jgi:hypothetical protein
MLLARCSWLLAHPAGWLARGWLVRVTGVREDPDALGELSPSSRLVVGAGRRLLGPRRCAGTVLLLTLSNAL